MVNGMIKFDIAKISTFLWISIRVGKTLTIFSCKQVAVCSRALMSHADILAILEDKHLNFSKFQQ
jgi:hypothetical protein